MDFKYFLYSIINLLKILFMLGHVDKGNNYYIYKYN